MSTSIIRFEDDQNRMVYCKHDSYPTGIGFDLVDWVKNGTLGENLFNKERFSDVEKIPEDIQYEYIIQHDGKVHCQECWFTPDQSYHGGGMRHGGVYDLVELREKVRLQNENTYRRPEYWN